MRRPDTAREIEARLTVLKKTEAATVKTDRSTYE